MNLRDIADSFKLGEDCKDIIYDNLILIIQSNLPENVRDQFVKLSNKVQRERADSEAQHL